MAMDVIDYEIRGAEMQFVEVELDPGEAAIGEAGSLMFMDAGIAMDTVFGAGGPQSGGFFGKLMSAGKRLVTVSLCSPRFTPTTAGASSVWPLLHRTPAKFCRWICGSWAAHSYVRKIRFCVPHAV
jgi:uncharacterized protein (AIM24 family)